MNSRIELGRRGEEIVARHLAGRGARIVARNFACPPHGELDIVALETGTLLFVEVKSRVGGSGLCQALGARQIIRLRKMGRLYMTQAGILDGDYRFRLYYVLFRSETDPDPRLIAVDDPF